MDKFETDIDLLYFAERPTQSREVGYLTYLLEQRAHSGRWSRHENDETIVISFDQPERFQWLRIQYEGTKDSEELVLLPCLHFKTKDGTIETFIYDPMATEGKSVTHIQEEDSELTDEAAEAELIKNLRYVFDQIREGDAGLRVVYDTAAGEDNAQT